MKLSKNIATFIIAVVMAILCFAQFSQKKSGTICKKYQQETATASVSDMEDFSLVNLLTLKFM